MSRLVRLFIVPILAVAAVFSFHGVSAQMMHDDVLIVVETSDGAALELGEVCITGEVDLICQEIPAGTPSGREFEFDGLADGEHTISAGTSEKYRPAEKTVNVTESGQVFTLVLERYTDNLPDTGAGIATDTTVSLAGVLIVGATMLAIAATGVRRVVTSHA